MGVRDNIRNAKPMKNSPDMQSGAIFDCVIETLKETAGTDSEGNPADWFVAEVLIEKTQITLSPEEMEKKAPSRRPNAAGTSAAIKLNTKLGWAANNAIALLTGVLPTSQEELFQERCAVGCEKFAREKNCEHKTAVLFDDLIGEDNPCAGVKFRVETYDKPVRTLKYPALADGSPDPRDMRTRFRYTRIDQQDHPLFKD